MQGLDRAGSKRGIKRGTEQGASGCPGVGSIWAGGAQLGTRVTGWELKMCSVLLTLN